MWWGHKCEYQAAEFWALFAVHISGLEPCSLKGWLWTTRQSAAVLGVGFTLCATALWCLSLPRWNKSLAVLLVIAKVYVWKVERAKLVLTAGPKGAEQSLFAGFLTRAATCCCWHVKDVFRDTLQNQWCCLQSLSLIVTHSGSGMLCPLSFLNYYHPFLMLFQCFCRMVQHL